MLVYTERDYSEQNESLPRVMGTNAHYEQCTFDGLKIGNRAIACSFRRCDFRDTKFNDTSIYGARFINCRFTGANFTKVNFQKCRFIGCSFQYAEFIAAIGLETCYFDNTCSWIEMNKFLDVRFCTESRRYLVSMAQSVKPKLTSIREYVKNSKAKEALLSDYYDEEEEYYAAMMGGYPNYRHHDDDWSNYTIPDRKAVLDCLDIEEFKNCK